MKELVLKNNNSLILITHNLAVVSKMTDKVMVMYCGKVMEQASTDVIIRSSSHPYTRGLLSSIPRFRLDRKRLDTIEGIVPNMYDLPKGCYFAPRCKYRRSICETKQPDMLEISKGHFVYCHFPLTDGDN